MKIEKVNIDSIKVYPNNAKIHTADNMYFAPGNFPSISTVSGGMDLRWMISAI